MCWEINRQANEDIHRKSKEKRGHKGTKVKDVIVSCVNHFVATNPIHERIRLAQQVHVLHVWNVLKRYLR